MLTVTAHIGKLVSATTDRGGMLTTDDLRPVDRQIVEYLAEGRVTPAYARERLAHEDVDDYSRGYVQQRLARLEEHGHVTNLFSTGLYELVDDPRDDA
jgi:hypothetical protein